jgi:hypothetical protein
MPPEAFLGFSGALFFRHCRHRRIIFGLTKYRFIDKKSGCQKRV